MTRKTSGRRGAAVAAVAATASLALITGCTGGSNSDAAQKSATKRTSASQGVTKADNIVNDPTARPSVRMKDCAATSSGWAAAGTVTNTKDKTATFTIVVSFTTKQSTVLARGTTTVSVKARATKKWTAAANFAKSQCTQCVLRGVSES